MLEIKYRNKTFKNTKTKLCVDGLRKCCTDNIRKQISSETEIFKVNSILLSDCCSQIVRLNVSGFWVKG